MSIFMILAVILIVIAGVYSLATGKDLLSNNKKKQEMYDEAAYSRYMRTCGGIYLFIAAVIIVKQIFFNDAPNEKTYMFIELGVVIAAIIFIIIRGKMIPKKKEYKDVEKEKEEVYIDED